MRATEPAVDLFGSCKDEDGTVLAVALMGVSPIRVCGLGGARMSSTSGPRFSFMGGIIRALAGRRRQKAPPPALMTGWFRLGNWKGGAGCQVMTAGTAAQKTTASQATCPETSLVISNMLTCFLPLKTAVRCSSALIRVLCFLSCNPCLRM